MQTTNPPARNLPNRYLSSVTFRCSLLIILPLALTCFGLAPAPNAFGVTPAPDGAYPGANTAEGQNALQSLTSGIHNTALGYQTLFNNTTGHDNMASGFQALFSNTTGIYDTANGTQALYRNTTGNDNTATGFRALYSNTGGFYNMANGYEALAFNTVGNQNTANGFQALYSNTTGSNNTADGYQALYKNTIGFNNTASGYQALYTNTTGTNNTAIGHDALLSNTFTIANTAIGGEALANSTGDSNIALGYTAGYNLTTGDHNIDIGNQGVAADSDTIRIGSGQTRTFIAGISGVNEGGTPSAVYINGNGRLGTQPPSSSRRFKKEIKPMDQASEAILTLKPVTFHYKSDPAGAGPQFGLIAEEVAEVNPDLVVRDENGEIYTVRYEAVNAMLLNEFLKEHCKVQELKAAAAKQDAAIAAQQKQIAALTAGLQKVSDQLKLRKSAPQTASNNNRRAQRSNDQ